MAQRLAAQAMTFVLTAGFAVGGTSCLRALGPGETSDGDGGRDADAHPGADGDTDSDADVDRDSDVDPPDGDRCPAGCEDQCVQTCEPNVPCACVGCPCGLTCPTDGPCDARCESEGTSCAVLATTSPDLRVTCSAGSFCLVEAERALSNLECSGASTCQFDCDEGMGSQISCLTGSSCTVFCRSSVECRVRCEEGSECAVFCNGSGSCGLETCEGEARQCDGDIATCNIPCG